MFGGVGAGRVALTETVLLYLLGHLLTGWKTFTFTSLSI